jgi:Ca2+-binding RTX toxin-like protein
MSGGNGADTYAVDNLGDLAIETTGGAPGGVDIVVSSVNFELGANIEKLTLTGLALKGTGNELGNIITGNNGDNILDGKGGNDTLTGGIGNDTYVVDSVKDVVSETVLNKAGGGVDLIQSSVSFSLATRTNVENLTLTGAGDISGTGNSMANVIDGNSGANLLDGGAGADTLRGGAGNDTYIFDNLNDKVDEGANTDTGDEVKSSLVLGLFAGIENYIYTGTKGWSFTGTTANNKLSGNTGNDTLTGSDGDDMLLGNGGNDTLVGEAGNDTLDGGAGSDKMLGGAGNDTYVINALSDVFDEAGNADTDDVVRSSISINLTAAALADIEHIELTGTAASGTGNAGNNKIAGNAGANLLIGGGGNDTLAGNGGNDKLVGDLGDDWLDGGIGADTLKGGAGNDVYVLDSAGDAIEEDGNVDADDLVRGAINVDLSSLAGGRVEHATLTGTANINALGNVANNKLTGNDGANELNGAVGADTLAGGLGNDIYIVDASDQVVEAADGGTDLVKTSLTFSLASLAFIENLTLAGTSHVDATGNALNNVLTGNDGINRLDGGVGNDTMIGGKGDDTYVVDAAGDVISETVAAGGGADLVESSVDFSLSVFANVENLRLTGSALNGIGNGLANVIIGTSGNNTLDGLGGADTLKGGVGNDIYVLDSAGDAIDEEANVDADDLVRAAVNVDLTTLAGGRVEHATLTGTANINALGNTANNKLTGNDGANELDGSVGADTLAGGLGNDTYVVDASDQVVEAVDGGTDLVKSNADFSLVALAFVENVTLIGTSDIDATGNGLDNVLDGNEGANQLDGGVGNDTMIGGKGDDTYVVDDAGDVISETVAAGGGTDLVESSVDYSLAAFANVENLKLTGGALSGAGNGLANVIVGTSENNTLDGLGGADTLKGGVGNDIYVLDSAGDAIDEEANADQDDSVRSANILLTVIAGIEHYHYQGSANWTFAGTADDNIIKGGSGNDILDGGVGNDVIDGGAGKDKMTGGSGNDTYWVDDIGDSIDEQGNTDSADAVFASISINLQTSGAGIEDVTLYLNATDATGNSLANRLYGNLLDNLLDGGTGADTLYGGDGNDTYVIDDAGDQIVDLSGKDTVKSASSLNLASFTDVENLTLTGAGDFDATGDGGANVLIGNSGDNVLSGLGGKDTLDGGAGSDTLKGGADGDIYVIDDAGDQVTDLGGVDLIRSYISLSLASLAGIENLTLLGAAHIDATGNGLANVVTGNDGDNILAGAGGADTLIGGSGNDTYLVSDAGDVVVEAGGGIDTIVSDVDFSLLFAANVENLTLTEAAGPVNGISDAVGTTGDNTLIGNSFDNALAGIEGNDRLFGGGGDDSLNGWTGDDFLVGGGGADDLQPGLGRDTLDYNHLSEAGDTIAGFATGGSGDILDLHDLLVDIGYAGSDPFAEGYLKFSPVGNQTQVWIDADGHGAGGAALLTTLFGALTQADTSNYII